MAVSSGLLAANWRRSPKQYGLKICHYYRLPGNAVDTSGVLIFCLVPPQKVAEITPFHHRVQFIGALAGGEFLTGRALFRRGDVDYRSCELGEPFVRIGLFGKCRLK